jgi:hypothetical protein
MKCKTPKRMSWLLPHCYSFARVGVKGTVRCEPNDGRPMVQASAESGQWPGIRFSAEYWIHGRLSVVGKACAGFTAGVPLGRPLAGAWSLVWCQSDLCFVRDGPKPSDIALESEGRFQDCGRNLLPGRPLKTPAFWVSWLASSPITYCVSGVGNFSTNTILRNEASRHVYHQSLVINRLDVWAGNFWAGVLARNGQ